MATHYTECDQEKCWKLLAQVLCYGHTIPFYNQKRVQQYILRLTDSTNHGVNGYWDVSCAEYLLDDIHWALFGENLAKVTLMLDGQSAGPISDYWSFTFTKDGLVKAYNYYNDD